MPHRLLPNPADLHYFLEITKTLNISRASERLGISQPSLSLAVKRLEDSMSVPLLIRNKTGVKLTRAGQRLANYARSLLEEWEQVRSNTLKDENEVSGRFTIGCHPSVALYSLPGFFLDLIQDHPTLEISLIHDLSRKITEDVISFKIDFGIVVNPVQHPDLVIKLLEKDEVSLWKGKGNSAFQDPYSGQGILICDPNLLQTQNLMKQLDKAKMEFARMTPSSNLEVIATLASQGAGIGILPERVATRSKSMGLEKIKGAKVPKFQDSICLIFRADAQKSFASRKIIQSIEGCLK